MLRKSFSPMFFLYIWWPRDTYTHYCTRKSQDRRRKSLLVFTKRRAAVSLPLLLISHVLHQGLTYYTSVHILNKSKRGFILSKKVKSFPLIPMARAKLMQNIWRKILIYYSWRSKRRKINLEEETGTAGKLCFLRYEEKSWINGSHYWRKIPYLGN